MSRVILYNGKLHTEDPRFPSATGAAIDNRRILAVGTDAEVRALAQAGTRQIDLKGHLVVPGMTDSHFHYYDWALGLRQLDLASATSLPDLRDRLARRVENTPAGQWIVGQGWNEVRWPEPRLITRSDLDDLVPLHPTILWRSDMHLAVANSVALQAAGINAQTPAPPQGVIDHDPAGQPSGILRELAINMVRDVIPPPEEQQIVEAMQEGFGQLHRLGLTGVHDFRIMGGKDGAPAFRAYATLLSGSGLPMRVWMLLPGEQLDQAIALGMKTGFGDDYLRVGHVKFFSDGGQGARTAWMSEPYEDTGTLGMPLTPMEQLAHAIREAHRAGLAVAVHAIGDRANHELLSVFEEVLRNERGRGPSAPHRIEHVQNIRPEDVVRLGQSGVVASVQPLHITDDFPMIERSVGPRARWSYPFRDLLGAGATLALGSDCPVANPSPLWGIHAAVTRQRRDGTPKEGWYPDQRITVTEAIHGFTMGPALASGQAAELGSLSPGKLADLVVLDRDIRSIDPQQIAETQVLMTIFDGGIVFER